MSGVGELSEGEREALRPWDGGFYSCACPDRCPSLPCDNDRDDLYVTVERIVAERTRAAVERAEVAEARLVTLAARISADEWDRLGGDGSGEGAETPRNGPSGDERAIPRVTTPETGAAEPWFCLHCGDSHETHEGDCCCHGHDEGDDE